MDVAFAPTDPNIVYVLLKNKTVPVYKSTDNGKTWQFLTLPFEVFNPSSIAISPLNPNIVMFSDFSSTYRSSDGGLTWCVLTDTFASDIIDFKITGIINDVLTVAVTEFGDDTHTNIWQSTDSGVTWQNPTFNVNLFGNVRVLAGKLQMTISGTGSNLIGHEL